MTGSQAQAAALWLLEDRVCPVRVEDGSVLPDVEA